MAIDDASLQAVGGWPWPGRKLGELIRAVEAAEPLAVGMDILRAEKGKAEDDTALAEALRAGGNVYLPCFVSRTEAPAWFFDEPEMKRWQAAAVSGEQKGGIDRVWAIAGLDVPLKELADAAAAMGTVVLQGSSDGVYREAPPVMTLGGRLVPSLPLALALRAMKVGPESVNVVAGQHVDYGGRQALVNDAGLMMINFAGPSGTYAQVPAAEVLAGKAAAMDALRGRIVLIGATAPGLLDVRPSPYDPLAPGVEGLANVTANLMNGGELRPLTEPAELGLSLVVIVGVAAAMSLLAGVEAPVAAVGLLAAYWLASVAGFSRQEVVTPLLLPTLSAVAAGFAALAMKVRKAEAAESRAMEAFRLFVPPQVAERLVDADVAAALRGERRVVTVLFMDMQGSTVYTRELPPEDFVEALNRFFAEAHAVVWRWEGTLDKFIGDGLLAFFNAPAYQEDHALRAVRAGLDLLAMVERDKELWEYHGLKGMGIRVGIATGEVVVGYVGSEDRQQYTVIGPAVNLAARLIELGKAVGVRVLVSDDTYAELGGSVEARDVGVHRLAGFDVEQQAYEVVGVKANTEGKE